MYNSGNENTLIATDIVGVMTDYTPIQPDIDETKIKAAALIAQNMDLTRVIGEDNVARCITPSSDADNALLSLLIPPLCYFTFSRLCRMFPGTFTDSGYEIEEGAVDKGVARSVANEYQSTGEAFLQKVIDFLKAESPNDENVKQENLTPRIRVFGGKEIR